MSIRNSVFTLRRVCHVRQFQQSVRGIKLSHNIFQPPVNNSHDGPQAEGRDTLVLLHGLFGSKRNWETLAKSLAVEKNLVVTIDIRNHGDSPHDDVMNYHAMSDDVVNVLGDLGIDRATVVGHSMGGKVAMTLALTRPDIVSRLVVVDIAPNQLRPALDAATFRDYISAMKSAKLDSMVTNIVEMRKALDKDLQEAFPDKGTRSFILTNLEQKSGVYSWRVNLDAIERNLGHLLSFPDFRNSYLGNVLFIAGSRSTLIGEDSHPEMKRLFPRYSLDVIDGAGHWVHSEKPYEFLECIRRFIHKDVKRRPSKISAD